MIVANKNKSNIAVFEIRLPNKLCIILARDKRNLQLNNYPNQHSDGNPVNLLIPINTEDRTTKWSKHKKLAVVNMAARHVPKKATQPTKRQETKRTALLDTTTTVETGKIENRNTTIKKEKTAAAE